MGIRVATLKGAWIILSSFNKCWILFRRRVDSPVLNYRILDPVEALSRPDRSRPRVDPTPERSPYSVSMTLLLSHTDSWNVNKVSPLAGLKRLRVQGFCNLYSLCSAVSSKVTTLCWISPCVCADQPSARDLEGSPPLWLLSMYPMKLLPLQNPAPRAPVLLQLQTPASNFSTQ